MNAFFSFDLYKYNNSTCKYNNSSCKYNNSTCKYNNSTFNYNNSTWIEVDLDEVYGIQSRDY